jgi:hypothetical protein
MRRRYSKPWTAEEEREHEAHRLDGFVDGCWFCEGQRAAADLLGQLLEMVEIERDNGVNLVNY